MERDVCEKLELDVVVRVVEEGNVVVSVVSEI